MNIQFGGFGLLTATLVILKAFDKINWSWMWVFSPLWIPFAVILLILIFGVILAALGK